MASDIVKALFERKTARGKANKLIDAFFEGDLPKDTLLHFTNEVLIHKHPKLFIYNTKKYVIKPQMARAIQKMLGV